MTLVQATGPGIEHMPLLAYIEQAGAQQAGLMKPV